MTRQTYTKPNSHARQEADRNVSVMRQICKIVGFSKDEWLMLMFEIGWQWAQLNDRGEEATIVDSGFWSWFLAMYIHDDSLLLSRCNHNILARKYYALKNQLIDIENEKIQAKNNPQLSDGNDELAAAMA